MKLLSVALALAATPAFAAISASTQWSIMNGGSANNGAAFDPSVVSGATGVATDLASTSSSSTTPNFSSATYYFVTADAGSWVFVGAGSGWQVGWYKISSVTNSGLSNAYATVDAAIGHVVLWNSTTGTCSLNTVAGCGATTGGTFSIDYTQATAGIVHNATFGSPHQTTTLTNTVNTFTPVMIGNGFQLTTQGTGSYGTLGIYVITAYATAQSVTVNGTPDSNASNDMVAATGYVGGPAANFDSINSAAANKGYVAGNTLWLNGAISESANVTLAVAGTASAPVYINGYYQYRGDAPATASALRTNSNGPIILTNVPVVTTNSTHTFASILGTVLFNWIGFQGSYVSGGNFNPKSGNIVTNCVLNSTATGGGYTLDVAASNVAVLNCDILASGATGAQAALYMTTTGSFVNHCRIINLSTSAGAYGIQVIGSSTVFEFVGDQILGPGVGASPSGFGVYVGASTATTICLDGCTVAGWYDDFNTITGNTATQVVVDSMLTDSSHDGFNNVLSSDGAFIYYTRFNGNANANIDNGSILANLAPNSVTAANAGSVSDYTGLASFDVRLSSASLAVNAGVFSLDSIGALQLSQTGSTGAFGAAYSQ